MLMPMSVIQHTLSTLRGACDDVHAFFVLGNGMGLGEEVNDVYLARDVGDANVTGADTVVDPVVPTLACMSGIY